MKIALIIPGFQADEHDWCIPAFTNLARELARHVEVHVFALRYPPRRDRYKVGDVHVHAMGGSLLLGRRVKGAGLANLWRGSLDRMVAEHRRAPFSAIIGIWATESGWLATRAARLLKVPSLVHLAGGELIWIRGIRYGNHRRGLSGLLSASSIRGADVLTAPSATIERLLAKKWPREAHKCVRWPLGVDTSMFSPPLPDMAPVEKRPFTFITVGSLIPVKGHDRLLRAMSELRRAEPSAPVRLRIVGSGPLLGQLRSLSHGLGLKGYVELVGEIEHARLPRLYREADCFVSASLHEAQGMAALEAMSCGLPWIAPPVGTFPDLMNPRHPRSGTMVPHSSPEALTGAMLSMAATPKETLLAWGQEGRMRVLEGYSAPKQALRLVQIATDLTRRAAAARI